MLCSAQELNCSPPDLGGQLMMYANLIRWCEVTKKGESAGNVRTHVTTRPASRATSCKPRHSALLSFNLRSVDDKAFHARCVGDDVRRSSVFAAVRNGRTNGRILLIFNPFTPKRDQLQISPAASPEILHQTVRRTWLFKANSDENCLCYQFSLPHTFLFRNVGRMYFLNLGVNG